MNNLEKFGEELVDFIFYTNIKDIPLFYYDSFLNFLGVTKLGSNHQAVSILIQTLLEDHRGDYQPINRKEKISQSDCAMVDCLSSSIYAYDDIHFKTTTHPCGVIASAILALSRTQSITLHDTLEALCIGMEIECRVALAMFSSHLDSQGWYTTGIAGGIGAAAAISKLLHLNKEQIKNAIGLACNYASGIRGSHGSMTGSFIPSIASKNGYLSAMMAKNGFTCHFDSLVGKNGLILQITRFPDIDNARRGLGTKYISMESSCKPYPLGFISFALLSCCQDIDIHYSSIQKIVLEVSSTVMNLGSKRFPKTMYEGFVSLPYIIARAFIDKESIYTPLENDIHLSSSMIELIQKIELIENKNMNNNEAKIMVYDGEKQYYSSCHHALGSSKRPMTHDQIIEKVKKIFHNEEFIEKYYNEDILDTFHFVTSFIK